MSTSRDRRPKADPSQLQNTFADRLSQAIAERGLSLARIQSHLKAMGPAVSVAALSYWASGRSLPTRARSLDVVRNLEQILQVETGWLVAAMPADIGRPELATVLRREELVRSLIEEHGLPPADTWHYRVITHRVTIGADGVERSALTRLLMSANVANAQRWALAIEIEGDGKVVATTCPMASVVRQFHIAEDLAVIEFSLERPVSRGQTVLASHEVRFLGASNVCDATGYGLRRSAEYLTIEVVFEGELPTQVRRMFRQPGDGPSVGVENPVVISGNTAQAVVASPAPGLHYLTW